MEEKGRGAGRTRYSGWGTGSGGRKMEEGGIGEVSGGRVGGRNSRQWVAGRSFAGAVGVAKRTRARLVDLGWDSRSAE